MATEHMADWREDCQSRLMCRERLCGLTPTGGRNTAGGYFRLQSRHDLQIRHGQVGRSKCTHTQQESYVKTIVAMKQSRVSKLARACDYLAISDTRAPSQKLEGWINISEALYDRMPG